MPSTPEPINNPAFGKAGTPLVQGMRRHAQQLRSQAAQAQQGNIYDGWMNTVSLSGSNLDQEVTIGAAWGIAGVQVRTNLGTPSAPVAGIAKQENLVTATVTYVGSESTPTLTAGLTCSASSNTAILDSSLATEWAGAAGYVIGAADLDDFTDAIVPGTVIEGITTTGGTTTITLTPPTAVMATTGNITVSSETITNLGAMPAVGAGVSGSGIQSGTTVTALLSSSSVKISKPATATTLGASLQFTPFAVVATGVFYCAACQFVMV